MLNILFLILLFGIDFCFICLKLISELLVNYQIYFEMINRMIYKQQPMNLVHRTKEGTQLWLGDYYAATNLTGLKNKAIKSVLTSACMLGIVYPKDQQINHKVIHAKDLPSYKMTQHFDQAFHFINDSLKKGNILVHCAAGISRSTTCVIVYLMRAENMTFKQALDYVRSKRPIVCPNDGFQKQLKRYQLVLKQNPKKEKDQTIDQSVKVTKQQKKVVLEFLKEQKKENQQISPYVKTLYNNNPNDNYKGFLRGKSLNYTKKPNNIVIPEKPVSKKQDPSKAVQSKQSQSVASNKIANQYLTFKLQNPKIVTIKK